MSKTKAERFTITIEELEARINLPENSEAAIWMKEAVKYLGVTELSGAAIAPQIDAFFNTTISSSTSISVAEANKLAGTTSITGVAASKTVRIFRPADESGEKNSWCSAFMNHVMIQSIGSGTHNVGAYTWQSWGYPVKSKTIPFGAVLIFRREGGMHVAFYVGEDANNYYIYGGNQSQDILRGITSSPGIVGIKRKKKVDNVPVVRWPFEHKPVEPSPVTTAGAKKPHDKQSPHRHA